MKQQLRTYEAVVDALKAGARVVDSDGDEWRLCATEHKLEHNFAGTSGDLGFVVDHSSAVLCVGPFEATFPTPATHTPTTGEKHAERKACPLARGALYYFPDALMELARLSAVGNEQHNKGQPMHWAFSKSSDHGDCILRHQADYDEEDDDGVLHAVKVLWRAAAQLQTLLEKRDPDLHTKRQAQRDRQARGER